MLPAMRVFALGIVFAACGSPHTEPTVARPVAPPPDAMAIAVPSEDCKPSASAVSMKENWVSEVVLDGPASSTAKPLQTPVGDYRLYVLAASGRYRFVRQ